jgi:arylformamidase
MEYIASTGVKHLLLDLPSVDRESDEGKLIAHRIFWNYPSNMNLERTITEMIFVDNNIPDGTYLLELQVASFNNDASPSRPVIYTLKVK